MKRVVLALACVALIATGARADAADERTATDGTRSLAVSKVRDLNPDGEAVDVQGSGYDASKGIYVAFCLIPPKGQKPSPCSGGDDRDGASGGSIWLSSNQVNQAAGARDYNGSFHVRLYLRAVINENVDCRVARCAVVTRNDHTRGDDRSQDLFVPVNFRATSATTKPPVGAAPTTTAVPPTLPTTTTTTIAPQFAAPTTTIASDGLSVGGGGKTLRASITRGLKDGERVTVVGEGFDATKGIYVSLCAAAATPGPCASGSAGAQAWISSNPPAYGKDIAVPYGIGGGFTANLVLTPVIDNEHDCREIACAITARNDDTNTADRSQDLLLPVSFAKKQSEPKSVALRTTEDAGSNTGVVLALLAGALAVLAGVVVFIRKRA